MIDKFNRALILFRELGDRSRQGKIILGLCRAYRGLKEPEKALEFCQQSLILAREFSDKPEISRNLLAISTLWFELGLANFNQGQADRALKQFLTAKKFAEEVNNRNQVALILIYLVLPMSS